MLPVIAFSLERIGGLELYGGLKLTKQMLPSGVAMAIGMYVTPNFTLPRVVGALISLGWRRYRAESLDKYMIVAASGLVLGEGIMSILTAVLKTANVSTWA
jgi:uncharacterized oligopeptide transporter (OPT) family protein